jgi:hypothetical protein
MQSNKLPRIKSKSLLIRCFDEKEDVRRIQEGVVVASITSVSVAYGWNRQKTSIYVVVEERTKGQQLKQNNAQPLCEIYATSSGKLYRYDSHEENLGCYKTDKLVLREKNERKLSSVLLNVSNVSNLHIRGASDIIHAQVISTVIKMIHNSCRKLKVWVLNIKIKINTNVSVFIMCFSSAREKGSCLSIPRVVTISQLRLLPTLTFYSNNLWKMFKRKFKGEFYSSFYFIFYVEWSSQSSRSSRNLRSSSSVIRSKLLPIRVWRIGLEGLSHLSRHLSQRHLRRQEQGQL